MDDKRSSNIGRREGIMISRGERFYVVKKRNNGVV